jgi:hypothetical protein
MPQWYPKVPGSLKVKENDWPVCSWLLVNIAPCENNGLKSLTMVCGTESWFVQVTVVPAGTVTDAGEKAKSLMVMLKNPGSDGVAGTVVTTVVWVVVTGVVGATVLATVVMVAAGGTVVAGVAGVVAGACPGGVPVHPVRRTSIRTAAPTRGHQVREFGVLIEDSSRYQPSQDDKPDPHL